MRRCLCLCGLKFSGGCSWRLRVDGGGSDVHSRRACRECACCMAGRWPLHPPREQHETPPPQQLPWGFRSWVGTRLAGFRICPCQGDFYLAVAPVYNTHVSLFPAPFPFPQPFLSTAPSPPTATPSSHRNLPCFPSPSSPACSPSPRSHGPR